MQLNLISLTLFLLLPLQVLTSTTPDISSDVSNNISTDRTLITPLKTPLPNTLQTRDSPSCSSSESRCGNFCLPEGYKCCHNEGGCARDEECQKNDDGDWGCCPEGRDCRDKDGNFFHRVKDKFEDFGDDVKDKWDDVFGDDGGRIAPGLGMVVLGGLAVAVVGWGF